MLDGLSEKTSTRRLPVLAGAPDAVAGVARRPNKSADGDGVDCKKKKTGAKNFFCFPDPNLETELNYLALP